MPSQKFGSSPFSRRKLYRRRHTERLRKVRQFADGRGEGVEKEPNHVRAKAWSSISHSILSKSNDPYTFIKEKTTVLYNFSD